jgi:inhibitor of cysteine peptidase
MGAKFCRRQRPRVHAAGVALLVLLGLRLSFASERAMSQGVDAAPGARQTAVVTLTRGDDGNSVEVHVGDSIVVQLPENPTTGFTWAIDQADAYVLRRQSFRYSAAPSAAVGGGGQRSFRFKAVRPGTVTLQLKLWREWEGAKSVADRYAATIRVTQ